MKAYFVLNEGETLSVLTKCEAPHLPLLPQRRYGETYCCPICGHIWAQFCFEGDNQGIYTYRTKKCRHCGGGSLIIFGDYPLDFLPLEALVRELDLILEHGERYEYL